MSHQAKWRSVNYADLPHLFYGRGIVSPCGRFFVSVRSAGSKYNALNWGVLDLYTSQFIDGFRFRRDAVASVEQSTVSVGLSYTAK